VTTTLLAMVALTNSATHSTHNATKLGNSAVITAALNCIRTSWDLLRSGSSLLGHIVTIFRPDPPRFKQETHQQMR